MERTGENGTEIEKLNRFHKKTASAFPISADRALSGSARQKTEYRRIRIKICFFYKKQFENIMPLRYISLCSKN